MMRVRHRNPRAQRGELEWSQRYRLSIGWTIGPQPDFADEQEAHDTWQAHRQELIEREARKRGGLRPWAFWRWDVGRPELVADDPDEEIDPADYPGVCSDLVLARNAGGGCSMQPHPAEHVWWCFAAAAGRRLFERRLAYLVEHDLLLPGEGPPWTGRDWPSSRQPNV